MNKQFSNNGAIAHSEDVGSADKAANYVNFIKTQKANEQKNITQTEFIFADEKMLRIREIIHQIADANVPVLITGESGTGKDLVARMIHAYSGRKDQNFLSANCASLPSAILESDLFGFEEGAFPGATQKQTGKFQQANNGTILLEEVTETDQNLQAKLLRAIQESVIEPLGSNKEQSINTRIIATTNRDLPKTVAEGKFRQDLFYRLYVIHLEIPPLRERRKDIEVLARHFVKSYSIQFKGQTITLTADAMQKLKNYNWPGNVRELQNVLQRAVLMNQSNTITAAELHLEAKPITQDMEWVKYLPIGRKMRDVEVQFIIETLKKHNGNRTHSAKTLGISLRTLRNKINEFTIEGHEVPQPTTGKAL